MIYLGYIWWEFPVFALSRTRLRLKNLNFSDLLCKWFVIPLLFLLESYNPSNVSPVRGRPAVCSDVVFNNSPIFPFEFPNFSLTMFEVRTILPNLIFAAHTSLPFHPLPSCPPAILSSLKFVNKYGWCIYRSRCSI